MSVASKQSNSMAELKNRLTDRATDSEETIRTRLENATMEMARQDLYDHVIINDKLDEAIETDLAEADGSGGKLRTIVSAIDPTFMGLDVGDYV